MINIISKAYLSKTATGPKKVVDNLIKGLDLLGYPYVINKRLDSCKRLWIHDDVSALKKLKTLPSDINVVVGPNIFILPRHIPENISLSRVVYLHPSRWIKNFWMHFGYTAGPIEVWPAGIDTNEFKQSDEEKDIVLVYFKQRFPEELKQLEDILREKHIAFEKVVYGEYQEAHYKKYLSQARYVVWLGRHESQGIALEEALACNVPMLVWDVKSLGHWTPIGKEMSLFTQEENDFTDTTSAEYFDDTCGIKIKKADELDSAIERMEKEWQTFKPRNYILNTLGLEKQAKELIEVFDTYYGLSFNAGKSEQLLASGDWINNRWSYKISLAIRSFAKGILRHLKSL
ncbi:MAG: hypothetical protein ACD_81C00190G0006 [uncultured bacterium]|uniref:Glycosyl transferase family 1 domain-containing protein n=1 Tax=Candidatus Wolfebacteria bacterium GW2011_GWC2_39_22 TaxID=1619013 RepID=A0A0G0QQF6_9BACT|nr:MAG: hypothetical protein ACD_81C00190G0006 [uncultured bacterium]KKR12600.1 MAG: hypothetical protein UT41_C0001G0144 [Candidatus Wolfebacteria bacterium GW2011_GWC2_39_22]HBI25801.1 hypothetical protein [Candidatus Wolfebacteria bacterium]